jgi:hypothetical protein
LVIVYFTVGFSWLYAVKSKAQDAINNHDVSCYQTCTSDGWPGDYYNSCQEICSSHN